MNKFLSMSMKRTEMEACKDLSPAKTCKKLKKKGKCDSEAAEKNCKKTCDHCDDEEVQEGKFLRIIQLLSCLWGVSGLLGDKSKHPCLGKKVKWNSVCIIFGGSAFTFQFLNDENAK